MPDTKHTIKDTHGKNIAVFVRRDKRLKKSSRWQRQPDGSILMRVPYRLPRRVINQQVAEIASQLDRQVKTAKRRTDHDLAKRARYINKKYFGGKMRWIAIRWVGNMNTRLGSCTNGGPTDGHIRISDKIKRWPQWVIDYVIAHELVHRLHPNHSKAFWKTLNEAYPDVDRARGFVEGVGFAEGTQFKYD